MNKQLLIVDDDEFIRSATQGVLELAGYSVEVAGDGLTAWEMIDSAPSRFDLILLDKQMPRLNGIELLKRIKSDERLKALPVILLTGDTQEQNIAEGLAEGAYYYLIKPSAEAVLKLVVKNALNDFTQRSELLSLIGNKANNLGLLRRAEFSFRTLQEARGLAIWLADASMNAERTVTGYSEILINAVEHGNLGISYAEKGQLLKEGRWEEEIEYRLNQSPYAERRVSVVMEKNESVCMVTVTDQGSGFDWMNYLEFSADRVFDLHGRGIAMSKALSFDSLEYLGRGNCVVSTLRLNGST